MANTDTSTSSLRGLRLGTGRAVITPPVGSEMSGFVARTEAMAGIHDELYARAMVWAEGEDLATAAALVTLDVLDLNASSVALIRARATALTGIPAERIAVTCTHTHGGAVSMLQHLLGHADPAYVAFIGQAAAGAIAMAAGNLEPVVVRWACGSESTVGMNRRVDGGVIDPALPVLRFQRPDGMVAAMLVSYACHPVTLGPTNRLATADYPGYAVRTIEAVYPGAMAQFATGCCGQINTGHTSLTSVLGLGSEWRSYGEAERLGRILAATAVQAAEQAARFDIALPVSDLAIAPLAIHVLRETVPMPMLPAAPASARAAQSETWRQELAELERTNGSTAAIAQLRIYLEWAAGVEAGTLPTDVSAEVMVIALGEIALVFLPGESFVEFGLAIKAAAAPRPVITLAYANGCPGYIPHRSAYPAGGYEVTDAFHYYGFPNCFAPEAGEALVATATRLLAALD